MEEQEIRIPEGMYKTVLQSRRVQGWSIIGVYAVCCVIGVVMNAIDVVKVFTE